MYLKALSKNKKEVFLIYNTEDEMNKNFIYLNLHKGDRG